jgi:peroxiredoxin
MRRDLTLTVTIGVVIAVAVVATGLLAMTRTTPSTPALALEGPAPGPHAEAQSARVPASERFALALDEAVRELDLVRPPRPKLADDFTVTLMRGDTFRLKEQRGKPVMINFWATWCAPCREEMPAMERLHRRYKEQGFVMLAVSVDSAPALVTPFLDTYKLTFPVAMDPKMELANTYRVRALPSSFIVDRDRYLAAVALGPRAWDNRAARSLVEGMLKQ